MVMHCENIVNSRPLTFVPINLVEHYSLIATGPTNDNTSDVKLTASNVLIRQLVAVYSNLPSRTFGNGQASERLQIFVHSTYMNY